jgi:hypothetical protein
MRGCGARHDPPGDEPTLQPATPSRPDPGMDTPARRNHHEIGVRAFGFERERVENRVGGQDLECRGGSIADERSCLIEVVRSELLHDLVPVAGPRIAASRVRTLDHSDRNDRQARARPRSGLGRLLDRCSATARTLVKHQDVSQIGASHALSLAQRRRTPDTGHPWHLRAGTASRTVLRHCCLIS